MGYSENKAELEQKRVHLSSPGAEIPRLHVMGTRGQQPSWRKHPGAEVRTSDCTLMALIDTPCQSSLTAAHRLPYPDTPCLRGAASLVAK